MLRHAYIWKCDEHTNRWQRRDPYVLDCLQIWPNVISKVMNQKCNVFKNSEYRNLHPNVHLLNLFSGTVNTSFITTYDKISTTEMLEIMWPIQIVHRLTVYTFINVISSSGWQADKGDWENRSTRFLVKYQYIYTFLI